MPGIRVCRPCTRVPKQIIGDTTWRTWKNQTRSRGRRTIYFDRIYLFSYQAGASISGPEVAWGALQLAINYWFWISLWPNILRPQARTARTNAESHCSRYFTDLDPLLRDASGSWHVVNKIFTIPRFGKVWHRWENEACRIVSFLNYFNIFSSS